MIISRTPLRISFCGGGSDLPSFYQREAGAVVSTTINKYIYISVNQKFDNFIRASYSITEFAEKPGDLKHELIRESLLLLQVDGGIEITSISDIPSEGSGLGSSSAYTVGLLNALHAFKEDRVSPERLAKEACEIEIERCRKPVGKQDQYAAAFGDLNFIQFNPDETVWVEKIGCCLKTKKTLQENLLMLYTGLVRKADYILARQKKEIESNPQKRKILAQMVQLAKDLKRTIEGDNLVEFGHLLHENWELKKKLAAGVSSEQIDCWYQKARTKGALGGKILGAGGGGFLLLYAPREKHGRICAALPSLRPISFKFEPQRSKIIYHGEE